MSPEDTQTLDASCLCGAARHQITLPSSSFPLPLHLCECNSCRHLTGTLALTVFFLPEQYKPAPELLDKLIPYEFSKRITAFHCRTCGTQMFARCYNDAQDPAKGESWDVCSGTVDKIEGLFEMHGHEFVADSLDGGFADFLTTYEGKAVDRWPEGPNKGEQLSRPWEHPDRSMPDPKPDDRLHARCKCGGVEFWVARPSERSKQVRSPWPDLLIPAHTGKQGDPEKAWWLRDDGKKYLAGVCSCNSCRLHTGMEYVEWAFVPTVDITLDAEGKVPFTRDFGTLKAYNSSEGVTRHHCDTCGATVFFFCDDRPYLIDVSAALLTAKEGARAESWLKWSCKRLSFREDALPRAKTLTLAVEGGLEEYGKRMYPHQRAEKSD